MAIRSICLLLGRDELRDWLKKALVRAEAETDASVDLIVRTDSDRQTTPELNHPFEADTVYAPPEPASGESRIRIPAQTVDRITDETDVVVQNGVGVLTGRILTAPEYGVLSYHHGDIRRYRGVVTHLWNYLNGDESGGVTLLQLDESLDAGGIAAERTVELASAQTWDEIEHRKHQAGIPLVADAIRNFDDPTFQPTVLPEHELGRMYYSSDVTFRVIAQYLVQETTTTVRSRLRNLRYLLDLRR